MEVKYTFGDVVPPTPQLQVGSITIEERRAELERMLAPVTKTPIEEWLLMDVETPDRHEQLREFLRQLQRDEYEPRSNQNEMEAV